MVSAALGDALEGQTHDGINVGKYVGMANEAVEQQEHVLSLVRESPSITIAQMAQALGVSRRQMERIVADLKAQGRLARTGSRRNGRWETR